MSEKDKNNFLNLKETLLKPCLAETIIPSCTVRDDQIVWGRCPVRFDFAGGWSDTPPYCLDYGGQVLNIAVNLNNQPPVQVYARKIKTYELVIRSIDLGQEERMSTYADVSAYNQIGSGFALSRAAFALVGFDPIFNGGTYKSLAEQLEEMGGGIELIMMAAVPKGSGLGVSSILSATILGVLSDYCGYNWNQSEILYKALVLEQMLTSGGGWQDQAGGVLPGLKFLKTLPGPSQIPSAETLPSVFFENEYKERSLLYYTGITRVAKNILGEIVKTMFLKDKDILKIVDDISVNAEIGYQSIISNKFQDFVQCIQHSWTLNKKIDIGTSPDAVSKIIDSIDDKVDALKLLGAGGGGYMYIIAKDKAAAASIKSFLQQNPPNNLSRFVDFSVSNSGLEITRS